MSAQGQLSSLLTKNEIPIKCIGEMKNQFRIFTKHSTADCHSIKWNVMGAVVLCCGERMLTWRLSQNEITIAPDSSTNMALIGYYICMPECNCED